MSKNEKRRTRPQCCAEMHGDRDDIPGVPGGRRPGPALTWERARLWRPRHPLRRLVLQNPLPSSRGMVSAASLVLCASLQIAAARLLHSLPEDPHAFPKFRVSFMNGQPIGRDTAERWLREGLRGGELEFADQPWHEGSAGWRDWTSRKEIGGSESDEASSEVCTPSVLHSRGNEITSDSFTVQKQTTPLNSCEWAPNPTYATSQNPWTMNHQMQTTPPMRNSPRRAAGSSSSR